MDIKAIDIWVNLFTPEALKKTYEAEEFKAVTQWWGMTDRMKGWSPEEFIAILDDAGVEKVFIPAIKMKSWMSQKLIIDQTIEEVARVAEKYPDRIMGLYGIDPHSKGWKECGNWKGR